MKIAEVVAVFPPYPGGTGNVCFHNARELAYRGHDVTVFTVDYKRFEYKNDPDYFKIIRLTTPLILGTGALVPQLYVKLRDYDIIHLHYPFFGGAEYIYLSALLRGHKYFLTYHMDVYGYSIIKNSIVRFYEAIFMKRILKRAVRIGALSFKHIESSRVAKYIDWDKVIEIPNGVDTEMFAPQAKDPILMEKYNLKDKTVILFIGHLIPHKGLHILIDAISMIKNDDIILIVVGEGYWEKKYKNMVKDKGLYKRVIFTGYKSHTKELPKYYNLCDFVVLPSILSESFGMVIIEAMASGKPAIVSSLQGPLHLIEDGKDGLVAKAGDSQDLKDKIEYLVHEKQLRQQMGTFAREKVFREYRWGKIGERLERVFEEILSVR